MVVLCAPSASADESTSTNFILNGSPGGNFGGTGTSSNFTATFGSDQFEGIQSTSSNFQILSGESSDSFTPLEQRWRWYDDENNETPADPLAGEDVAPSNVQSFNTIKLRVTVANVGTVGESNIKFKLQFATSSDFSSGARDVVERSSCSGSSEWCYANGVDADNDVITTAVLSDADSCVSSVGDGCGTHNESGTSTTSFTQNASTTTEYEFTVLESGATANTVYFFRLFNIAADAGVPLNAGQSYPSLSSEGTTLTFTVDGVPASTLTSGTTTTIDTTSTEVPFGSMNIGSSHIGAQRLTVSTGATQGYQVFSYAQQDFVGTGNDKIPPFNGTNASPVGWASGCLSSVSGCYGYHTGEAVLAGGSTRFAPDDTYAQFSTTSLSEVAYNSGATTTKSTDIVYKVEVHDLQDADSYSTGVVYIVVPTF